MTTIDDLDVFAATPAVRDLVGRNDVAVPAVDVAALLAASVSTNSRHRHREHVSRHCVQLALRFR